MEKIKEEELAEMGFCGSGALSSIYVEAFSALHSQLCSWGKYSQIWAMEPVMTYQEYFRKNHPDIADCVMLLSDPDVVMVLDRSVKKFNADLERIKREEDEITIISFLDKLIKLVRLKRSENN